MFQSYFYIEASADYDADFWVQWLTPDGKGIPDIDLYDAELLIDNFHNLSYMSVEVDTTVSAFRFRIEDCTLNSGHYDTSIIVDNVNHRPPGATDDNKYVIATGVLNVLPKPI